MAHALTEAALHTATVTVPDNGDLRTATSLETAFQALANRTHLLRQQMLGNALIAEIDANEIATDVLNANSCQFTDVVTGSLQANTAVIRTQSRIGLGPDANSTITPTSFNVIMIDTLTADRIYTLSTDAATATGDWLTFICGGNPAYRVTITGAATTGYLRSSGDGSGGEFRWITFRRWNTLWRLCERGA